MPSYCPPAQYQTADLRDTLERTATPGLSVFYLREAERANRSRESSRYLTSRGKNYALLASIERLGKLPPNWNSYEAPAPSAFAIREARKMLEHLAALGIAPDKVNASAEGGIAIVFLGARRNRAIIESLNNDEQYLLLYDLDGRSQTLCWPTQSVDQFIQTELLAHLQGRILAA